jgi:hypothetical protein
MWTFSCHLYHYKMIIILNDMNNDNMIFQCNTQMTIFEQHGNWCIIEEWLWCNDMDNINMVVSTNCEMTKIWRTIWKLITTWLMHNDMSPPPYLLTYPPLHLSPYLLMYPPTHLPLTTYLLLTYHRTTCLLPTS